VDFYLAKEFVDVPMMLSHPFDEMVKLFDKITDLPTKGERHSSKAGTITYIIAAEVKTRGPRKHQRERLSNQILRIRPAEE
jgi:hypothetical protein